MRSKRCVVFLVSFLLIAVSCQTTGINRGQLNLISTEEEIRLGQQLSGEIENEQPLLNNPAIQQYVSQIGQRLAAYSDRPDLPYSFKVIDNDEQVNAFALPGGPIYVFTGLLKFADNEAELAAVMGHEIAHITARHSTEQLTKAFGIDLLAQLILGRDPSTSAVLATNIVSSLGMLKFSRNDEIEADRLGVQYMFRAGYNPNAMLSVQEKLASLQEGQSSRVLNFLSTHPMSQDRILSIKREIAALPPGRPVGYFEERYRETIGRRL